MKPKDNLSPRQYGPILSINARRIHNSSGLPIVNPRHADAAAPRVHVNASQRVDKDGGNRYIGTELTDLPARGESSMTAYRIKSLGGSEE